MPHGFNNLLQQVWLDEIDLVEAETRESIRTLTNIYERLKHQQAPPELLERVFDIRSDMAKALDSLAEISACFPKHPRHL